jgi:ABC-type uncharacterized transport system permease subunit
MKIVIEWIWTGPWWALLVGAFYAAVVLGISLGPILGVLRGAPNPTSTVLRPTDNISRPFCYGRP